MKTCKYVENIIYTILEILFYVWGYFETMATIYLSVCLSIYRSTYLDKQVAIQSFTKLLACVVFTRAVMAARQLVMTMTSVVMICIASKITWGRNYIIDASQENPRIMSSATKNGGLIHENGDLTDNQWGFTH